MGFRNNILTNGAWLVESIGEYMNITFNKSDNETLLIV